ncbi:hypothetical protein PR048_027299 [Dryococelus australis]|uniref:Uncharacterized protein n=1 Tax=Dryococelus australis TaxID=614101 RepID=A0ABQ9GF27_9NEOP|nr:hypothetical protein PR048_027299 [Dryococelus australis]
MSRRNGLRPETHLGPLHTQDLRLSCKGLRGLSGLPARLPPRRSGFNPRLDHSGFSHVGIVRDDAVGRRIFSGIGCSRGTLCCVLPRSPRSKANIRHGVSIFELSAAQTIASVQSLRYLFRVAGSTRFTPKSYVYSNMSCFAAAAAAPVRCKFCHEGHLVFLDNFPLREYLNPLISYYPKYTRGGKRENLAVLINKVMRADEGEVRCVWSSAGTQELDFTVLCILEPAPFLHWLPPRCEVTPFLTELYVIGAHSCEVFIYWHRVSANQMSHQQPKGAPRAKCFLNLSWVLTLRSTDLGFAQPGEPGSNPGRIAPEFPHVRIVKCDTSGQRVLSRISRFVHSFVPALLHTYHTSPSSALTTLLIRAAHSPFDLDLSELSYSGSEHPCLAADTSDARGFISSTHEIVSELTCFPVQLTEKIREFSDLQAGLYSLMNKYADINCTLDAAVTVEGDDWTRWLREIGGGYPGCAVAGVAWGALNGDLCTSHRRRGLAGRIWRAGDCRQRSTPSGGRLVPFDRASVASRDRLAREVLTTSARRTASYTSNSRGNGVKSRLQGNKIQHSISPVLTLPSPWRNRVRFPSRFRIFACGNRDGRCRWSAGFLGDLPFPRPFHSGAASYSPHFTLIDHQDSLCSGALKPIHHQTSRIYILFTVKCALSKTPPLPQNRNPGQPRRQADYVAAGDDIFCSLFTLHPGCRGLRHWTGACVGSSWPAAMARRARGEGDDVSPPSQEVVNLPGIAGALRGRKAWTDSGHYLRTSAEHCLRLQHLPYRAVHGNLTYLRGHQRVKPDSPQRTAQDISARNLTYLRGHQCVKPSGVVFEFGTHLLNGYSVASNVLSGIGKFRGLNDLLAGLHSLAYTRASDVSRFEAPVLLAGPVTNDGHALLLSHSHCPSGGGCVSRNKFPTKDKLNTTDSTRHPACFHGKCHVMDLRGNGDLERGEKNVLRGYQPYRLMKSQNFVVPESAFGCKEIPLLIGLHVIRAHHGEVFVHWRRATQGVSNKLWSNDKRSSGERASGTACLPPRRTWFNPRPVHSGFAFSGNRAGRCRWSAGFLGDIPFSPLFHYGSAPYSPRFTLIGSQDFAVESRQNLFTQHIGTPFAKQCLVSFFSGDSSTNREFMAAHSSQSDTRAIVPMASCSQSENGDAHIKGNTEPFRI